MSRRDKFQDHFDCEDDNMPINRKKQDAVEKLVFKWDTSDTDIEDLIKDIRSLITKREKKAFMWIIKGWTSDPVHMKNAWKEYCKESKK